MQNLVHDLLAVRKIGSGESVHIGITDFELPGQDFLLHTGHHLFHNLYAAHELLRSDNVRFTDVVPLCNLLADARFRRGGRNCVNLTQFLLSRFLRSYCILPSGTLSALHGAVLQRLRSNLFGISINNNQEGDNKSCRPLDCYLFPCFGFLSDIYNLELV